MDIVFNKKRDKVASFSCRLFPVETISIGKGFFTKKDFKVLKYQVYYIYTLCMLYCKNGKNANASSLNDI